jgi:[ribosomal protein S18]-alanine N-acetyltransferase
VTPDALAAIHAAAFTDPRPWSAAEFAALMGGPGVFLCTLSQGLVMGRVILDEAELLTIAVDPQAQRRGIGARLLAAFEAESLARGAVTGFLEVSAANPGAQRLYARAGWRETGRRRGYYRHVNGAPCDAIVMARTFAQPKA